MTNKPKENEESGFSLLDEAKDAWNLGLTKYLKKKFGQAVGLPGDLFTKGTGIENAGQAVGLLGAMMLMMMGSRSMMGDNIFSTVVSTVFSALLTYVLRDQIKMVSDSIGSFFSGLFNGKSGAAEEDKPQAQQRLDSAASPAPAPAGP